SLRARGPGGHDERAPRRARPRAGLRRRRHDRRGGRGRRAGARRVRRRPGDTLSPGLIELHNPLSYDALPLWQVPQRFDNRGQWMRHRDYRRFVSGPATVLGKTGGFLEAVVRYVEAKCLLGGGPTSQGIALASNMGIRRFYKGLVRNVEDTGDDALPAAGTRVADVEAGDAQAFL